MGTNGPTPTTLVFLNDLAALPRGSKVRFLGCVTNYAVKSGILSLQHAYQVSPRISPVALVDVNLLLSTLRATDTQHGEWINVMGYVEDKITGSMQTDRVRDVAAIGVQAILLWSAGSVRLGEYEKTLTEKQKNEDWEKKGIKRSSILSNS